MTDLKDIKAFAFDIDGVMTDGGILADLEGQLYRTYDAKDGFAVRMASMSFRARSSFMSMYCAQSFVP